MNARIKSTACWPKFFVVAVCVAASAPIDIAMAQRQPSPLRAVGEATPSSPRTDPQPAPPKSKWGGLIKPTWPFKRKAKVSPVPSDPFAKYGADTQRQLATRLAGQSGTETTVRESAPQEGGPQVTGEQPIPVPRRSYPWPQPVDSTDSATGASFFPGSTRPLPAPSSVQVDSELPITANRNPTGNDLAGRLRAAYERQHGPISATPALNPSVESTTGRSPGTPNASQLNTESRSQRDALAAEPASQLGSLRQGNGANAMHGSFAATSLLPMSGDQSPKAMTPYPTTKYFDPEKLPNYDDQFRMANQSISSRRNWQAPEAISSQATTNAPSGLVQVSPEILFPTPASNNSAPSSSPSPPIPADGMAITPTGPGGASTELTMPTALASSIPPASTASSSTSSWAMPSSAAVNQSNIPSAYGVAHDRASAWNGDSSMEDHSGTPAAITAEIPMPSVPNANSSRFETPSGALEYPLPPAAKASAPRVPSDPQVLPPTPERTIVPPSLRQQSLHSPRVPATTEAKYSSSVGSESTKPQAPVALPEVAAPISEVSTWDQPPPSVPTSSPPAELGTPSTRASFDQISPGQLELAANVTAPSPGDESRMVQSTANVPVAASRQLPGKPTSSSLGKLDEGAQVLATVGDQSVLASELLVQIDAMLEPYRGQAPDDVIEQQRQMMLKQFLPRVIEGKLIYIDFLRSMPPDRFPEIQQKVFEHFNESKLPKLLEEAEVETAAELDAKLREAGSSLLKQQQIFMEHTLGQEMVRQNVDVAGEVSHQQMLDYYHAHLADYEFPTRVRWRQVMVRWDGAASREQARAAVASMGNAIQSGRDFADVARADSQGPRADEGGEHDWTGKGALRSEPIDEAIFSLPVNTLSTLIEDEDGVHIVQVVERQDAGRKSFREVQDEIRDAIREQRFKVQVAEYVDRLKRETHVWTVFDETP